MIELGELILKKGGSVDPLKFPNEKFQYYSIPAYDKNEAEIVYGKEIGSSKKLFLPNDVLLSRIVPHIRRCWIVGVNNGYRQIGSSEWITFRSDKITPSFLRFYLMSNDFNDKFLKTIKGVGGSLMRADPSQVAKFQIPLPPLEQQKKIAAILDAADAYRQKTKALITKYDELTQSLFLDMFGDPVSNPKGCEIVTLDDITSKITDGVHAKPVYTDSGVPFISVKDITTGVLKFENCKFISEEAHSNYYKRCNPEYLDILYTKVGATYGRPAIVDVKKEFSLYVSVALIKPKKDIINPYFLKEVMGNPVIKRQADKSIKGIGVPDLHLNMIKKFLLPLPPMETQILFSQRVEKIEEQKAQAQASLEKAEELFNSLLQRAFKGGVV